MFHRGILNFKMFLEIENLIQNQDLFDHFTIIFYTNPLTCMFSPSPPFSAAVVTIPKPPPGRTVKAIEARKDSRRKREANETTRHIHNFEEKMKMVLPPSDERFS